MEHGVDVIASQRLDEVLALRLAAQDEEVGVGVRRGLRRPDRPPGETGALEVREGLVVSPPQRLARGHDAVGGLELCPQKRREDIARKKRRADVDPSVLVDLPAEELAAVGAFLADDFSALDELVGVDQERAALARDQVLGLVKADRRKLAEAAERLAAVGGAERLRGVFDQNE